MVQQIVDQNGTLQHVIMSPEPMLSHNPAPPQSQHGIPITPTPYLQPQPPTSATPPTLQPPNNHNPQSGGHAPHLPHQMHPNGGVAVSSPNVYANFIPGNFT